MEKDSSIELNTRRHLLALGAAGMAVGVMAAVPQLARADDPPDPECCSDCLKLAGLVSVKDYGAVGDGSTDDTEAIQAAIDNSQTIPGREGAVFFPTGVYRIVDTLKIENMNNISLIGMRAAIFQDNAAKDILLVKNASRCAVKDIYFSANNSHTARGIVADSAPWLMLENVQVYWVGSHCLWATNSWWLSVRECKFGAPADSGYCVHHENDMNNVMYLHTRIAATGDGRSGSGLFHKDGSVVTFISCDFSGNDIAADIYAGNNITFTNCYFESNSNGIKWGDDTNATWPQCGLVDNCYFTNRETARSGIHIDIQRGTNFRMNALKLVGNGTSSPPSSGTMTGIRVINTTAPQNNRFIVIDNTPYAEAMNTLIDDAGARLKRVSLQAY
jgi:hypothetical protein